MHNMAFGILAGIIVGLICAAIFLKGMNKDGKMKTKYDERQKEARGRAYMYGFYATVISNAALLVLSSSYDLKFLGLSLHFIPIVIGIIAQVTYSIFHDAYVGLNNNMKKYTIGMTFISAFNIFVGVMAHIHGELMVDGVLQGPFVNILCGGIFLLIAIEFAIKKLCESNEE